ncbi:MAG TPA: DNA polymerase/3'-5' exonuclease PolX [Gammaproteobacteria bacterium]|nr:DNA polymerase/3'-5' exonuclease PolX [Gammaproteobacteria bacterium]
MAPPLASKKPAKVRNVDIAGVFNEIADILEIEGANPYRIRAYRNGARAVEAFGRDIACIIKDGGELPKLPGIGDDLLGKIHEIADTGTCPLLERLHHEVPPAIVTLLQIGGLGPKRVKLLYHDLGIETPTQLLKAARGGKIRRLHGFGEKTERKLLAAVESRLQSKPRVSIAVATAAAEGLVPYLRRAPGVSEVRIAGSLRRMRDTIGDLDILAIAKKQNSVVNHFLDYEDVTEVIASGPTRASVVLRSGLQADLRVMGEEASGAALVYFTGSKAHNIAIRRLAQRKGLKISEYGVFRRDRRIAGDTESSVYDVLGLPVIPPELRENNGEIEAARSRRLPRLIELGDLRGDLHAHTSATDGLNSMEEMAVAARGAGLEYLAITDHSRHLTVAHGLDEDGLLRHIDAMDRLHEKLRDVTLLKGIEVDILESGELDLPDRVLSRLDLVVGAIHSRFDLPRARQTRRILRAVEHRYFSILAHPSCRLVNKRNPIDVDMSAVIRAAARRGCCLELNARPERLDLNDIYCREAKEAGVLLSVNSDAHSTLGFANLRFGIGQARRGWLEKKDVLNSRPLSVLRPMLKAMFQ